ncbi:type VI secretion system Vgr family protein [Lichenifustis flavocetrariae]|uniref:Type VI secretion system tip protein VgrG n=1 Tax=Lichenifustis flavocetrariae TaxID=2949735 RepID=A0AA41YRB4_9HYPH|nr:type VI secretion system tip protein TssI/VgrG [Lichenifustis flavocetrariae]MCW6506729.1 type VI secretion system tip protein VgrG [Lichenifustis flavocetrariae]
MSAALVQAERIATLTTPLGEDTLVLVRFNGTEHMSQLFEFTIDALSEERDVDFDRAIGRNCSVSLTAYGGTRVFNGILVEAQWLGPKNDYFSYRLVLRPWFWLLSRTTDCRIFEKKTVLEIIKQVFSDRGFNDFRDNTTQSYPQIEYCVQYRETDLDFVSRLMEQYGIYYFFDHSSAKHMLVMADAKSSHQAVPGLASLPFIALKGSDRREREHVFEWKADRQFRTGKVELKDYDYMKPNAKLLSDAKGTAGYTKSDMEFYDYPGQYIEQDKGDRFAKVQLEAEQARDQRRFASGAAPSLFPGGLTTLEEQIKPSENIQYLVLGATHTIVTESYRSGAATLEDQVYEGSYEFLPGDRPFRAPLTTPRPFVHGPQTAKVVGKSGEEIDVDEEGRILVQFYWDRKKMQSCRVRIAQVWSGKAWGGIFIPRIDQEVVVEFLEGNPDRPLVTGTVYNGDNKVPYDLPSNKTKNGWKTDSSKGHNGYNELVFEDKAGSEEIGIHAQKDLNLVVLNAETREIGEKFMPPMGSPSRSTTLKNGDDELKLEMGDQNITLAMGSQNVSIMMNQTTSANMAISSTAMLSHTDACGPLTSTAMTPASMSDTAPMIMITGMAQVTVTAPIINLVGIVNVTGLLTVNGMIPMLLPT